MVLTAHCLGLGTCYIGFVKQIEKDKSWMRRLKIEYPWAVSIGISLGYPKFKSDGEVGRDKPQIDWYSENSQEAKIVY